MKPKIGITIGDPAGIGPEITAKALAEWEVFKICTPIIIGNEKLIKNELKTLKIKPAEDNFSFYDVEDENTHLFIKGSICPLSAKASYNYILKAAKLAKEKEIEAIVTCPITKASLKKAQIPYIDHTEIFKSLFNENPITFLATNDLRTTFVMRHLSLMDSILKLTEEKIFATIIETHNSLQKYYKIKSPKIIVTGVNPHNGDFGLLGKEEETLVSPAVKRALSEGMNIVGPIAADSAFPKAIEEKADGVVSMFHDQGHIAIKTNNWKKSIGITLGLPIIRTSVDHGSALDIAGRGIAYNDSLIAAIKEAVKLVNMKNLKQPHEDQ